MAQHNPATTAASAAEIAEHGWTAVPVDSDKIFNGKPYLHKPEPRTLEQLAFPSDDALVRRVHDYAKEKLPELTYHHSMRVYYYAACMLEQQFPAHATALSRSTLALACLLHDIGTADGFIAETRLSFEWWGGFHALQLLRDQCGAAPAQAEAVAEAVIRHQDIGTVGTITFLGQLLQLATIYDNVGLRPDLVDRATRDAVVRAHPRVLDVAGTATDRASAGADASSSAAAAAAPPPPPPPPQRQTWSSCFADTIRLELALKPWAHSTHLGEGDFTAGIEANGRDGLMSEYEK